MKTNKRQNATLPMHSGTNTEEESQNDNNELPVLKVTQRRKLPTGIASNVKQHVILVRDHSTSMSGSKIDELNIASEALIRELANPENRDGFRVSVIDFNDQATRICLGEPAQSINLTPATAGGGTDFIQAIDETIKTIHDYKNRPNNEGWHYLRPTVLFLSDGQASTDQNQLQNLQEEAEVIAIAYGSDADQQTLKTIASDSKVHTVGIDGEELRQFLADVGKTLSQTLQGNRG